MRALPRPRLVGADLAFLALGGATTVLVAYLAVQTGDKISVGALLVALTFTTSVIGFIAYPHVAVAATILLFALVPMLKVFVMPEIGALKDLVVIAAASAATFLFVFERRRCDSVVLALVVLLLGMYAVNVGGGHGVAWAQGVRLVGEPLLLLLVGLLLPQPRRTFRWALGALVATACIVAAYGILQQVIGKWTLVDWGYSFEAQVRSLEGGRLRSFGTLDDPFAYAALLSFGFAAVLFWLRRGPIAWAAGLLILAGLGLSFVRTALLILIAFGGLLLRRWGYGASALAVVAATVVAGGFVLANAQGTQSQTYAVASSEPTGDTGGTANVILNGRISAWETALGDNPIDWALGRGVGTVGTAAGRATYTLAPPTTEGAEEDGAEAVDSGYLATIADVGFLGLLVLLALFGRLIWLALEATRRGAAGWVALSLLAALLLDALTRASFTGFPTAFLCLFLVGICIAAARDERSEPRAASA